LKVVAVDAYGSVLKKYHETGIYDEKEIYSYRIEGTGKNILPGNVDFELIDRFVKVTDEDSAFRAREMARAEAIFAGYSSGAALQCLEQIKDELTADDTVVLIFADHGSKYVSKVYNDAWMQAQGFLSAAQPAESVAEPIAQLAQPILTEA
jgi:cystathionine beta-synthase